MLPQIESAVNDAISDKASGVGRQAQGSRLRLRRQVSGVRLQAHGTDVRLRNYYGISKTIFALIRC